jgi:hypothetical protein
MLLLVRVPELLGRATVQIHQSQTLLPELELQMPGQV